MPYRSPLLMFVMTLLVTWLGPVAYADDDDGQVVSTARVWNGRQAATSEGEVVLAAAPATVYAVLTDATRWPAIFPRVRSATARGGGGVDIVSRKGKHRSLRFANDPRTLTVRFTESGGAADVYAEIVLEPGVVVGTTRARARLRADVSGFRSWFVSERTVREKRERRLRQYLADLDRYFQARARVTAAP
jgi:hypothetical protein